MKSNFVYMDAELVYESSFDETVTKYFQDGEFTVSLSEADDFIYRQVLVFKVEGSYTTVTNKAKKRHRLQLRQTKWFENKFSELN